MKIRKVMLAGVLMAALSASAVFAGEADTGETEGTLSELLESLFGEDGAVTEILPEKEQIQEITGTIKEKLGEAGSEIGTVLGEVMEQAKSDPGSLNLDTLKEYGGELLGMLIGGGTDDVSLDEMFRIYDSLKETEEEYMAERNAGLMEQGDVRIFTNTRFHEDEYEQDEIKVLTCFQQNEYNLNDENQLLFVSSARDIVLFTHQKDEEGNYPVKDAAFAEDSEDYMPSLEAFCEEVGEPFGDGILTTLQLHEAMVVYDLHTYLEEHPDIEGIEYDGEIRTAEELDAIWDALLNETFGVSEEEAVEDSAEEAVEDSAEEPVEETEEEAAEETLK